MVALAVRRLAFEHEMPLLHTMSPQPRSASDTTSQKCSLLALEQPLGNVSLKKQKRKNAY
jgi:hypothetical protein